MWECFLLERPTESYSGEDYAIAVLAESKEDALIEARKASRCFEYESDENITITEMFSKGKVLIANADM